MAPARESKESKASEEPKEPKTKSKSNADHTSMVKDNRRTVAKGKIGAKYNVKPKPKPQPRNKAIEKDVLQYLDDFLKSGKEEDINKLFTKLPITIKKWMNKDPRPLSCEYKALLEVVIKNIPSLLSNIEKINKNIDPTVISEGINKTIRAILRGLPKLLLRLLVSPGKTVDASLSAVIYTVLYALEGMMKFMTSMMNTTMESTMASQGGRQRSAAPRSRY